MHALPFVLTCFYVTANSVFFLIRLTPDMALFQSLLFRQRKIHICRFVVTKGACFGREKFSIRFITSHLDFYFCHECFVFFFAILLVENAILLLLETDTSKEIFVIYAPHTV